MVVSQFTENMMAKFPSWMKMAKDTNSIGAQFLDVFGVTFDQLKQEMDDTIENFYIDTANVEMVDILYKIPLVTVAVDDFYDVDDVHIIDNNGGMTTVMGAGHLRDFYSVDFELPAFFIDRHSGYLYLRVELDAIVDFDKPFHSVVVNGASHYTVEIHHVWNAFDEFGLLLGLSRLPRERNQDFKKRILDVFENPGGSTSKGVQNGLARELGIPKEHVEVIPFQDKAFDGELLNSDGTPTDKMIQYARQINSQLKFTWDSLNLGESYWFSLEQENLGIEFLPHIWDVDLELFDKEEFQSGIGHGDDLKVTAPKKEARTRNFKAYVSLMGYYEKSEEFFPEIAFQYKIYAQGKLLEETYQEEPFKYTVEAAEVFDQTYRLIAEQEFPYTYRQDFHDKNKYIENPDREKVKFGKSNEILHTQTDPIMKIVLNLASEDEDFSNWLKNLTIVWEDTTGKEHSYPFSSENDFLIGRTNNAGDPETQLAYGDIYYDEETNELGLGYGAFQKEIDTTVEWQQGQYMTDTVVIRNGEISLNLDQMNQLMN